MSTPTTDKPDARLYPSSGYAWYMVLLLTVAYILSFIDRYVLGLLIEPIKADMALSDFQISLLLGPFFFICYALLGLPLGWLADRKRRTWIVAAGVGLWSLATALTGAAKNFVHIALARTGVGIGEATLSPCAMSMISDSFPAAKRGRPIAFYTAALSLGAGAASLLASKVLDWADRNAGLVLPFFGEVNAWQLVFITVGLPGLVVALLFLFLREPKRQERKADAGDARFIDMLRYVGRHWPVYVGIAMLVSVMTITAYSQGWYAPVFERTWGWEGKTYAFWNGIVLLAVGPLTVNIAGYLSDKLYGLGRRDGPLLIVMMGVLILVPTAVLIPLMPSPELAMILIGVNTVGIAMASATGATALLNVTPGQIRGQTVALYYMTISFAGMLGPLTVGFLSDRVFGEEGLRYAVAVVPLAVGVPAILLMVWVRRHYLRELGGDGEAV